jgi:hypothetical protein
MKKILLLLSFIFVSSAQADTCSTNMMPAFTAQQSVSLCTKLPAKAGASIIPQTDNLYNLGSASLEWKDIFLQGTITSSAGNVVLTTGSVNAAAGSVNLTNGDVNLTSGRINYGAAASRIVPGATSFAVRNNVNNADNLLITDAGLVTPRSDVALSNTGTTIAIQEATAGSACSGTLTATGATPVVVSTTCATTGSRIFLQRTSSETGTVNAWRSALSNGVSFSVTSEAADTGAYDWLIVHEAP